jgi:hypothetical protein
MVPSIDETLDETTVPTRIIAVELTEEEWRAFRAIEPQPLAWLQKQIRERVGGAAAYDDDEY